MPVPQLRAAAPVRIPRLAVLPVRAFLVRALAPSQVTVKTPVQHQANLPIQVRLAAVTVRASPVIIHLMLAHPIWSPVTNLAPVVARVPTQIVTIHQVALAVTATLCFRHHLKAASSLWTWGQEPTMVRQCLQ